MKPRMMTCLQLFASAGEMLCPFFLGVAFQFKYYFLFGGLMLVRPSPFESDQQQLAGCARRAPSRLIQQRTASVSPPFRLRFASDSLPFRLRLAAVSLLFRVFGDPFDRIVDAAGMADARDGHAAARLAPAHRKDRSIVGLPLQISPPGSESLDHLRWWAANEAARPSSSGDSGYDNGFRRDARSLEQSRSSTDEGVVQLLRGRRPAVTSIVQRLRGRRPAVPLSPLGFIPHALRRSPACSRHGVW